MQGEKDAAVNALWKAYRATCTAMRDAKNKSTRAEAFAQAEEFMRSTKHRAYVHKWRGWGLLFDGHLHVVRSEVFAFMGIDDAVPGGAKRRKSKAAKRPPPKLSRWTYLRNEFGSAHKLDGPMLHLDPNGRDCVIELFTFALMVINNVAGEEKDPPTRLLLSEIERAAWQTIELIVSHRVYCAVLSRQQLQETLEVALAGIDFEDASRQGAFPVAVKNDLALLASVIHLVLTNTPYDRHDWLAMLVPFLGGWFETLATKDKHPFAAIAYKIIEIVTDMGRAYFTFIGELLLSNGMPMLAFTMRSWKDAPVYWRAKLAAFMTLYIELFEYHADSLVLEGSLSPRKVLKVAKAMLSILVDSKALQSVSLVSRSSSAMNSAAPVSAMTTIAGVCVSLDSPTVSHMVCTADIIYFHDRLLQRLTAAPTTRTHPDDGEEGKEDDDERMPLGMLSPAKRSLEATMPMAWEQLVHDILADPSETSSSSSTSTPQSQSRREQFMQRHRNRAFQHLLDSRLLLLSAVLRRHGGFYVGERIGDIVSIMDFVTQSLEVKEIDKQQCIGLHLLEQLAQLSQNHPDLKSDMFEGFWIKAWGFLLRQGMPYAAEMRFLAPQNGVGELVFTILNSCITRDLVPLPVATQSSAQLWSIYRLPPATTTSAIPVLATISKSPIAFLASFMRVVQPPSSLSVQDDEEDREFTTSSVRSRVLRAVFDHLEAMMVVEVNKPEDSRWQTTFDNQGAAPAVYAAALASFLGIPTSSLRAVSFSCEDLKPSLLRAFDDRNAGSNVRGGPDVEGFGAHFTFQDWGIQWLAETSSYIQSRGGVTHDPDGFSPLVQLFRPPKAMAHSTNIAAGTRADWERTNGFARLHIADTLARRQTLLDLHNSPTKAPCTDHHWDAKDVLTSVSRDEVESSMTETVSIISNVFDELLKKLTFTKVDAPYYLKLLDSAITIGLVLACLFAEAKDASSPESTIEGDTTNDICPLLKRFLGLFGDHLSARAIDSARGSTMMTSTVIRQLMNFHAFILVLQGRHGLKRLTHPCADPLELKIPSELRPAIRKVAATVEASLVLVTMDAEAVPNSQASQRSSVGLGSATPSTPASFDWDSATQSSQPKSSSRSLPIDVDADEDDIEGTDSTINTARSSHPSRILSLWSLRVILLLKRESGIKAVRNYGPDLGFTPDFLVATASMLCSVSGYDSLDAFVKILEIADEEVSQGKPRIGSTALSLSYAADVMHVLQRCASMYENRKRLHKEEVPESLLATARRMLTVYHQGSSRSLMSVARRAEVETFEAFFRLNSDTFGDFINVAMQGLLDVDVAVRFSSAKSLQTLFYMYPDGGEQVFRDLYKVLSRLLPRPAQAPQDGDEVQDEDDGGIDGERSITSMETCLTVLATLYICACSCPDIVPDVVLLHFQLAGNEEVAVYTRSGLLKEWLEQIAIWYDYPSSARMVDDHICFLWSHHVNAFINTGRSMFESEKKEKQAAQSQRVMAKALLETFPVGSLIATQSQERGIGSSVFFQRHVDIILPLSVLYDVACGGVDAETSHFLLVEDMADELMWKHALPSTGGSNKSQLHWGLTQEQLITDLFALSFVLHSLSTDGNARAEEIGATMLALAEDMALTHALSISHLGHVVMKMARFTVWNILSENGGSGGTGSSLECDAEHWLRAMKTMKEKYSGFDWARMNLAEILSEFHEMLLRAIYFEPLASRAIECLCLFVNEIKDAITDTKESNAVLLQHLLLHIVFETVKNVKRRDKKSSRKLTYLVRDICDHFMKNSTDAFGKYLNFVVQEIADILVRASRKVDAICLDSDDTANLEWIIFAICNNMASGLGKFMVDVETVPSGIAACLDKLNSMLVTSSDTKGASASKRRRSLDPATPLDLSASVSDKARVNALHQIEQFIVRASKVGERFYQPRTVSSSHGIGMTGTKDDSSLSDAAGMSSQLKLLRDHVRVVRRVDPADGNEVGGKETNTEVAVAQRSVLAKLTRTLFTLSTHYENVSSQQGSRSQADQLLLAIANILGEIGVWDANDFDLSPGQNGEELSRLYQRNFRRGALRDTKATFRVQMHEQLLQYLSSLMFESGAVSNGSAEVLHQALNTIKKVLHLDEGRTAVEKSKDNELRNFLEGFIQAPPSNWSVAMPPVGPGSSNRLKALWRSFDSASFEEWICALTGEMARHCTDDILRACGPLAGYRTDMAVFIFPYVLWATLTSAAQGSRTATIVNQNLIAIIKSASAPNGTVDDRVVQLLIHSINFLRETEKATFVETNGLKKPQSSTNTPTQKTTVTPQVAAHLNQPAYSCVVDVDLLDLAEAAISVKMPYSAMQFAEMWLEVNHGGVLPSLSDARTGDGDTRIRSILVDAFSFDDDVDGIYGVNDGRTFASQLVTYNRESSFSQSLPLYDIMLQLGKSDAGTVEGVLHALDKLGYHHLLRGQLESIAGKEETPKIQEHRYELAWKGLQWDSVDVGAASTSTELSSAYLHERTLYQTLKALAHRDMNLLSRLSITAKQQILKSTRTSLFGTESTRESSAALVHLQSIHEIEECAQIVMASLSGGTMTPGACAQLFVDWQRRREFQSKNDYDASESLLSLEEVLAQVVEQPTPSPTTLASIHLSLASRSRRAGRVAIAYKSLTKLEDLHKQGQLELDFQAEWKMERAKLLWSQRETRSAIWVAKQLHCELQARLDAQRVIPAEDTKLKMLFVESLTLTGKWIASQRSENSEVILHDYLHKATQMVDAMSEHELKAAPSGLQAAAKAHFALADYMAEMYHQVAARVTSREWLAGKRVAEARQRELAECLAMNEAKQLENRAHIHALNKEVQYDYEERTKVEASVDQFLGGAVRSFGRGLSLSAKSELAIVFRVMSLWFNNQMKPGVNRAMQEIVDSVPSYKFVPLSYQIISRVGSSPTSTSTSTSGDGGLIFERVLSMLVLKLCEQHPHHALVQLIALKNSGDVEGKGALQFRANVGDAKAESAKKYLDKLRKGAQRELLESLDVLSNAYVQLALSDTREHHKNSKNIPFSKAPIMTFGGGGTINFDQCLRDRSRRTAPSGSSRAVMPAVLTSSIPARPDMDYSSVSRVLSFDNKFSITDSGIHRPKIIYCIGSDGRRFKQLVKGKDDTRQDLVIEQVFDSVNQFLKEDQATRERNLRLRTYKVVPLSPIAGVLEWVDNTVPWGSYLVGRTAKRLSAHERYHPHEMKHADCRMRLKNATHDKLSVYKEIEAGFTPVFHHFFLEKYPDPAMWFKRRLAYVQSVAVTSIVGYILGIGDRHSQNILIHEETAELVHIDFGVVFDQGMALFTPETVPFRLTRDLVDGMGVSGVEGVFTRCCEATLQLLRKKSASVVTILEVFVHDPLYRWTLSPLKALKIQEEGHTAQTARTESTKNGSETDDSSNDAAQGGAAGNNDAAARALIRVKQKLEGYEDPNGNALSIEGQVKQLISAAQDPHNLCALFPGWAPWL